MSMRENVNPNVQRRRLALLQEFFTDPLTIGAIAPSSGALAKAFADNADLTNANTVVEVGPGTGAITRGIAPHIPSEADFMLIEINPQLVAYLREHFPELPCHHASATCIREILAQYQKVSCDRVISSLPWSTLPESLQEALLNEIYDSLEPGGLFLTFAYVNGLILPGSRRFRRALRSRFKTVETSSVVWRNLPPAVVIRAQK